MKYIKVIVDEKMEKSHQFLKLYNNEFLADVKINSSNGKQVILSLEK